MTVEFIAGPPGTGKTTALLERFERELAAGTPADRIGFVTFTRAARHEALDRASRKFNLSDEDLPWVRTVHGAAYKRLGREAAKLLSPALWREFATRWQYTFTPVGPGHVEDGGPALPRQTADDRVRAAYEWGRNRRLTIAETLARTSAVVEVTMLQRFAARYQAFKREKKRIDFTDILEETLRTGLSPEISVLFVDEAQDLSPLQIAVVEQWMGGCSRVYVAGDDDQAIFAFQGADPAWLVELNEKYPATVLAQSHRVPRAAHALADKVIGRNRQRVPKTYHPRDVEGSVERLPLEAVIKRLDPDVPTLILARNRCFLDRAAELLAASNLLYVQEGGRTSAAGDDTSAVLSAVRTARHLALGSGVSVEDFLAMAKYAEAEVVRPVTAALMAEGAPRTALALVREYPGGAEFAQRLRTGGPVGLLKRIPERTVRRMEETLVGLREVGEPNIRLTTIHAAKGREADVVVVIPDMTAATHREMTDVRHGGCEAENRVAYVAVTRTRDKLYIAHPQGWLFYSYPHR